MAKITEVEFARYATYIAREAASWAGECLMFPEDRNQPMRDDSLKRFTDKITGMLERMNEDRS